MEWFDTQKNVVFERYNAMRSFTMFCGAVVVLLQSYSSVNSAMSEGGGAVEK